MGPPDSPSPIQRRPREALLYLLGLAVLIGLMILTRPYQGIMGDARLYVGSALATLDPQGLGQDLMFLHDGQFGFSLFPVLLTALTRAFGPDAAALVTSLTGMLAWVVAAAGLAFTLADGRRGWAVAVCIVALSPIYGAFDAFQFGEAAAVPRPFAEAAVMAALAALMTGRRGLAVAFFALGAAMHPIMTLPGVVAALVFLIIEDRRWALLPLAGVAAVLIAGGMGAPIANRLFVAVDPEWLAVLQRSPYLFPRLWPADAWIHLAVQAATVLTAAALTTGRVRRLILAVAATAAGGMLVAAVFGDHWPLLLVVQVQTWRALWLLAVLANACLALCALGLWRGPPAGRLALALLIMAWLLLPSPAALFAVALALALALTVLIRFEQAPSVSPRLAKIALGLAALLAVVWAAKRLWLLAVFYATAFTAHAHAGWSYVVAAEILTAPLVAAALGIALIAPRPISARMAGGAAVLTLALAIVALASWDDRAPYRRMADAFAPHPGLTAGLASSPGALVWIGGGDSDTWFLARRPNWSGTMQGGGAVFSRALALAWNERMKRLEDMGLMLPEGLTPFAPGVMRRASLKPPAEAFRKICAAPDGPAAVVVPDGAPGEVPAGWRTYAWRPPVGEDVLLMKRDQFVWRRDRTYRVVVCPARQATALRP